MDPPRQPVRGENKMRKIKTILVGLLLAGSLGFAGYSLAQGGMQILTTLTGSELVSFASGTVSNGASTKTIAGFGRSQSLLYTTLTTSASAATTAEQTLASYTLPGGTLNTGTKLSIRASFSAAGNTHNKTFNCYFGAELITSGTLTTNAKNGSCEVVVTRISAAHEIVWANMLVDTTAITGYVLTTATDNDANAITLKFTGTQGTASAGDIVLNDFSVLRLGN